MSTVRLLITRPREEGEATARLLAKRGHETLLAPLLSISLRDDIGFPSGPFDGLIITSSNALRFLEARGRLGQFLNLPLAVVGARTAAFARALGFHDLPVIAKTVDELIGAFAATDRGGHFLYVRGREVRRDLAHDLARPHRTIEEFIGYEAKANPFLAKSVKSSLQSGEIDGVLLYSPRTARIFAEAACKAGLAEYLSTVRAYCLSAEVAAALCPLSFAELLTASPPTEEMLLALLSWEVGAFDAKKEG